MRSAPKSGARGTRAPRKTLQNLGEARFSSCGRRGTSAGPPQPRHRCSKNWHAYKAGQRVEGCRRMQTDCSGSRGARKRRRMAAASLGEAACQLCQHELVFPDDKGACFISLQIMKCYSTNEGLVLLCLGPTPSWSAARLPSIRWHVGNILALNPH